VPAGVIADIETAFEEEYPAVDLQVYRAGTGDVMARVEEELAAGRIGADLIWVADFTVGEALKEQGVLLQYRPDEADALLPTLQDEEGYYYAARLLNMVVAYNTHTTERIAAGELDIGITIDFTVRRLLLENPDAPIDFVYPQTGIVMVPSPIAIFRDASNVGAAKAFERYILSGSGQALLRDLAGVVPVRLDVTPPDGVESITQLRVIPADPAWIHAHHDQVLSIFSALYQEQ